MEMSHGRQGKPDIFVPNWVEGHALFDVGITHASQANRMADQKAKDFENLQEKQRQ